MCNSLVQNLLRWFHQATSHESPMFLYKIILSFHFTVVAKVIPWALHCLFYNAVFLPCDLFAKGSVGVQHAPSPTCDESAKKNVRIPRNVKANCSLRKIKTHDIESVK